jgi:type IV secretion system protein TrbB
VVIGMRHRQTLLSLLSKRGRGVDQEIARQLERVTVDALHDPSVIEVMVNADGRLWLERLASGVEKTGVVVRPRDVGRLLRLLASVRGVSLNATAPILDCDLPGYRARVQGIIPPISRAPIVTIRKLRPVMHSLEDYRAAGRLRAVEAQALRDGIRQRRSVVVCGKAGSGKTTLANALLLEKLRLGSRSQRIVILQERLEFGWCGGNVLSLRTSESADLARLLQATLRLRPDTIVVGEVRGREALEMLKAWNSRHPGGITTVDANDVGAALSRLDQLAQEAGVPPQPGLVGAAVDFVVAMQRTSTGRAVSEVVRVEGYDRDNGYRLREI